MDQHVVPVGRFAGRTLDSLTPAEQKHLGRTRIPALAESRARLRQPTAVPLPPAPYIDPAPCLPLVLYRRPQVPVPAVGPPWVAPARLDARTWRRIRMLVAVLIVLLVYPPLAGIPGHLTGWAARWLALRLAEVWNCFISSFTAQFADLGTDLLAWLECKLWPFPSGTADPPVPGQRLTALIVGFVALRVARPWG